MNRTPLSMSFWAAATPALGSPWSSSDSSSNLSFLPATVMGLALSSSTARRAPFSLSLPENAWAPDSGPLWPILTTCACTAVAASTAMAAAAYFTLSFKPMRTPDVDDCKRYKRYKASADYR